MTPQIGDAALFIGMTNEFRGTIVRVGQDQFGIHKAQMVTDDDKLCVTGDIGHWQDTVADGWIIRWQDATTLRTYQ